VNWPAKKKTSRRRLLKKSQPKQKKDADGTSLRERGVQKDYDPYDKKKRKERKKKHRLKK